MPDFIFNPSTLKNLAAKQIQKIRGALPAIKLYPVHSNEVAAGDWSLHYRNFNLLNPLANLMHLAKMIIGTAFKINPDKSALLKLMIIGAQLTHVLADGHISFADGKGNHYQLTLQEGLTDGIPKLIAKGNCDARLLPNSTLTNITAFVGSYCPPIKHFTSPRIFLYALNGTTDDTFNICIERKIKTICHDNNTYKEVDIYLIPALALIVSFSLYSLAEYLCRRRERQRRMREHSQLLTQLSPIIVVENQISVKSCLLMCDQLNKELTETNQTLANEELNTLVTQISLLRKSIEEFSAIIQCPITLEAMNEPATYGSGITCEKNEATNWLRTGNSHCPKSQLLLQETKDTALTTDVSIKQLTELSLQFSDKRIMHLRQAFTRIKEHLSEAKKDNALSNSPSTTLTTARRR